MLYGWTFLILSIALGAISYGGYAGAYAMTAKVSAAALLMLSIVAFACEKRCEA